MRGLIARIDAWFESNTGALVTHPGRIAVAYAELGGVGTYQDFVPTARGSEGQVIVQVSECDFVRVAGSFDEMLRRMLDHLEAGRLVFHAAGPDHPELRGFIGAPEQSAQSWTQLPTETIAALFP